MTSRPSKRTGVGLIDGSFALGLAITAIAYAHHSVADLYRIASQRIRVSDALFCVAFIVCWQFCFSVLNLYDRFATLPSRMAAIFKGVVTMTIVALAHLIFFHRHLVDFRTAIYLFASLFVYEVDRIALRDIFIDRISARNRQNVVVVGSGRRAGKAWREIRTRHHFSTSVLGFVDDRGPDQMAPDIAARYLGTLDDLDELLLAHTVDIVLIAMPIQSAYHLMQRAVTIAEGLGVRVVYLNDIYATQRHPELPNRELFQELFPVHEHYIMRLTVKRLVDVVISSAILTLLSPLLIGVALLVKLTSKGPVFFRQKRVGHKRRTFEIIRFRCTAYDIPAHTDALAASNANANSNSGDMREYDSMVTPMGRFLRSTSIDKLPQLWNVLRGDMSLVGPRPMSSHDIASFDKAKLISRFNVKPGLTGLLQLHGRSDAGFEEWVALDTRYIEHWSLALDLRIMARTVTSLVWRSGTF